MEELETSPAIEDTEENAAMETKDWNLEMVNNTLTMSFKAKFRQQDDNIDEFIEFIDKSVIEIEKNRGFRRITKSEIIKLFGLGVVLPSIDVWSDVYLAAKLHITGHHGWGQATLVPGYLNIVFCLIAWVKYENPMRRKIEALKTLPFVFLQLYPQVRALKVIIHGCFYKEVGISGLKWITDVEEYEATAAHLEGVVESTFTIFIQTAIVGSILSYQPKQIYGLSESVCEQQCSNSSVLLDLASCIDMSGCISACVEEFLTIDTKNYETEILNAPEQNWLMTSNITVHDVRNTQAYYYFVGEQTTFLLIYMISIVAASISFVNFLKSGFVRYIQSYLSGKFALSLLIVLCSFALKIYSLITFVTMDSTGLTNWMRKDSRTEGRSIIQEGLYWLLIFVLPNAIFALVSLIASKIK